MIVEPDFLEHWKTRLLVRLLGTEEAPLHVIRLWAHCQHRKTDRFTGWEPDVLASVCRWAGPAQTLWDSMLKAGFARIEDGVFIANGWADCNASLVSAWANGKLGGRPKKAKENEDSERNKKPAGNRSVIPVGTRGLSDREEKIEKTPPNPQGGIEQTLKLETEPAPKPRDPMEGFSLFWQSYPKKQGRTPAEKAWRKLQPDAETVRKIVEHVQARRTSEEWTKELGQFIPLPSTFLNQRRWTDETRVDVKPTATGKSGTTEDRLVAQSGVTL